MVSIARVMSLGNFDLDVNHSTDSSYFVKSAPPRAFSITFKYFAGYRQIEDVNEDVKC